METGSSCVEVAAGAELETSLSVSAELVLSSELSAGTEFSEFPEFSEFSAEEVPDETVLSDVTAEEASDETELSDNASSDVSETGSDVTPDDAVILGSSEREFSLRSPHPVRRAAQTAVHKKTLESFLIFINIPSFLELSQILFYKS